MCRHMKIVILICRHKKITWFSCVDKCKSHYYMIFMCRHMKVMIFICRYKKIMCRDIILMCRQIKNHIITWLSCVDTWKSWFSFIGKRKLCDDTQFSCVDKWKLHYYMIFICQHKKIMLRHIIYMCQYKIMIFMFQEIVNSIKLRWSPWFHWLFPNEIRKIVNNIM